MSVDPTQSPFRRSERADLDGDGFGAWGHEEHVHEFHQLIYVPVGHAVVWAEGQAHHVSSSVALLIPAGVVHAAGFSEDCLVVPVGLDVAACDLAPEDGCLQIALTAYLRRVLHHHLRERLVEAGDEEELCAALLGGTARLPLPEPRTEVARAVAHGLLAAPECQRTVTEWAATHYVSATSLSRAFRSETGLTFSEWRTRARLNASLGLLAEGTLISMVAQRVGFTSTNGYILAFRRHFGQTPKAFMDAGGAVA